MSRVQMYASGGEFVFRRGTKKIGYMPFDSLEVIITEKVNSEEELLIREHANRFVPGEIYMLDRREVVLGPKRNFQFELEVHPRTKPERGSSPKAGPRLRVLVCELKEAARVTTDYIRRFQVSEQSWCKDAAVVWKLPKPGEKRSKVVVLDYNGKLLELGRKNVKKH